MIGDQGEDTEFSWVLNFHVPFLLPPEDVLRTNCLVAILPSLILGPSRRSNNRVMALFPTD